jgi:putative SOS response-associated peptidase YedK
MGSGSRIRDRPERRSAAHQRAQRGCGIEAVVRQCCRHPQSRDPGIRLLRVADRGCAKVPHYVSLPGDELLVFAGLYEWWRNPAAAEGALDRWLLSATILTRASSGNLASLHERMPVFLDADMVEGWLDPQEEGSQELVDEIAAGALDVAERIRFHAVGAEVGSVQNNGEHLTAAVG